MQQSKQGFCFDGGNVSVDGVDKVVQISDKECIFRLDGQTLVVRGVGLNVVKLDKEQGVVVLEVDKFVSATYRDNNPLKGLFS